jgi:hypothetical protein
MDPFEVVVQPQLPFLAVYDWALHLHLISGSRLGAQAERLLPRLSVDCTEMLGHILNFGIAQAACTPLPFVLKENKLLLIYNTETIFIYEYIRKLNIFYIYYIRTFPSSSASGEVSCRCDGI